MESRNERKVALPKATRDRAEILWKRDLEPSTNSLGEKIADFRVTRDGLDEAIGGIDPDRMPPAFAFQHAALLL